MMTMVSISPSLNSSTLFLPSRPLQQPQSTKNWKKLKKKKIGFQELISSGRGRGICRAELVQDAPFAAAIGACILTSLVSPVSYRDHDDGDGDGEDVGGSGGALDSTDARFAVMGIISFIPYFNRMSWLFAWLDSGKQRYLVYAVVYLAPYLRYLKIFLMILYILQIQHLHGRRFGLRECPTGISLSKKDISSSENLGLAHSTITSSPSSSTEISCKISSRPVAGLTKSETATVISSARSTISPLMPNECYMYTASGTLLQFAR